MDPSFVFLITLNVNGFFYYYFPQVFLEATDHKKEKRSVECKVRYLNMWSLCI